MKIVNKLLIFLAFFSLNANAVIAQAIMLDETLLTDESFGKFTTFSVKGDQNWYLNTSYGAVCSGYFGGESVENENWLISPAMDLSAANNVKLTFEHTRGSAAVMNVGVESGWYKAFVTGNYTGDPATTNWVELEGVNQNLPNAWAFISSGELTIPASAKSANTRVAFRYISSNMESATWQIKNVFVTGEVSATGNTIFKIATWNVLHFGCTTEGPGNENLQLSNVAAAIKLLELDIVCLQEVTHSVDYPMISNLVTALGNEWAGDIVAGNTGNCTHNQGLIYRKSKVQFVNSFLLSNGNFAQGKTYYYNWTFGRYPALYNVNLVVGQKLIPLSLVNIHAKAMSDETSYLRRKGGSEGLKAILDGSQYNTKNLIIIGDFNDYLTGSSCATCGDSPYKNFMDDTDNYMGISKNILDRGCWNYPQIIDNMIISNELIENYVANSTLQERSLLTSIPNYCSTTSDHLPVSALFDFSITGTADDICIKKENMLRIYPNPVKDELTIDVPMPFDTQDVEIYDLIGRLMFKEVPNGRVINVNALPAGMYLLKIGSLTNKFVKQ